MKLENLEETNVGEHARFHRQQPEVGIELSTLEL